MGEYNKKENCKMKPSEREALKATLIVIKKKIEEFLGNIE